MDLIHFFFYCFSVVGTLLACLFLFKNQGHKLGNRLMALLLLVFAYLIFYSVLFWSKSLFPHLRQTYQPVMAMIGPVYYLYLRLTIKKIAIKPWDILHALPAIITVILHLPYYLLSSTEKINFHSDGKTMSDYVYFFPYGDFMILILLTGYGLSSFRFFSTIKPEDADIKLWLKYSILAFNGIVISYLAYYLLVFLGILTITQDYFISGMMVVFILLVGYMAFMQPQIFNGKPINEIIPFVKYRNTGLSESLTENLSKRLIVAMEKDKLYLNHDLDLAMLSEAINTSRNHTSQVLNAYFGKTFYEFVNQYRIKEVTKLMDTQLDQSLKDMAYSAGFNNRITFYKSFKRLMGIAPSDYVAALRKSQKERVS